MSFWNIPKIPVKNAVKPPIMKIIDSALCESSKIGDSLTTINIPAVTIVAACIKAEIGVGPSIESGNHTCKGICADLPIAPMKRQQHIKNNKSN